MKQKQLARVAPPRAIPLDPLLAPAFRKLSLVPGDRLDLDLESTLHRLPPPPSADLGAPSLPVFPDLPDVLSIPDACSALKRDLALRLSAAFHDDPNALRLITLSIDRYEF